MTDRLDEYTGSYGEDFEFSFDNEVMLNWYPRRIMALADRGSRVLDLGLGHGYACNHFSEHFAEYVVIDGSESIIERFGRQYPGSSARIIKSRFEDFDSGAKYDVVIMGFVLEHVDDPALILNRYRKFLARGGRCFVSVPNAESLHRRFGHEAGFLPDMEALGEGDLALGHRRLYTVRSLTEQMQDCGYRIVRREGIFLKPLTTGQLRSLSLGREVFEGMCRVGVEYPELCAGLLFEAEAAP